MTTVLLFCKLGQVADCPVGPTGDTHYISVWGKHQVGYLGPGDEVLGLGQGF